MFTKSARPSFTTVLPLTKIFGFLTSIATLSFRLKFDPLHIEGPEVHMSSHFLYWVKKGKAHSCNKNMAELHDFRKVKMLCARDVDLTLLTLIVEIVRAMSSMKKKKSISKSKLKLFKIIKFPVSHGYPFPHGDWVQEGKSLAPPEPQSWTLATLSVSMFLA